MIDQEIIEAYNKEKSLFDRAVINRQAVGDFMSLEEFISAYGYGIEDEIIDVEKTENGGPNSGFHGHVGIPGQRGGGAHKESGYGPADAISRYQDYGYYDLNENLRKGKKLDSESEKIDKGLQKAFKQAKPLGKEMTVRRYTGGLITGQLFKESGLTDYFKKELGEYSYKEFFELSTRPEYLNKIKESLIGKIFKDKGYSSCTKDSDFFSKFAKGRSDTGFFAPAGVSDSMNITIPKGNKVLDLGEDGFIPGAGENEVILNKNGKFKIKDVYIDFGSNSLMFKTEYLGTGKPRENSIDIVKNGGSGSGWWNPDHAMRVSAMFHSPAMQRALKTTHSISAVYALCNSQSAYPTSRKARFPKTDAARDVLAENSKNGIKSELKKTPIRDTVKDLTGLKSKASKEKLKQDDEDFQKIAELSITLGDAAFDGKSGLGIGYLKNRLKETAERVRVSIKQDEISKQESWVVYKNSQGKKVGEDEVSNVKENLLKQLEKAMKELEGPARRRLTTLPEAKQSMPKNGGPNSGNFGHAGRLGEVGGSSSDSISISNFLKEKKVRISDEDKKFLIENENSRTTKALKRELNLAEKEGLKLSLTRLVVKDKIEHPTTKNALGTCGKDGREIQITLKKDSFTNPTKETEDSERGGINGRRWWTTESYCGHVIRHELGHALSAMGAVGKRYDDIHTISNKVINNAKKEFIGMDQSQRINAKKTPEQQTRASLLEKNEGFKYMSEYGTTNPAEMVAESYSNPNYSEFTKLVYKHLRNELKDRRK